VRHAIGTRLAMPLLPGTRSSGIEVVIRAAGPQKSVG
jgi:hypothetical protein